jgi:hypothetical protein
MATPPKMAENRDDSRDFVSTTALKAMRELVASTGTPLQFLKIIHVGGDRKLYDAELERVGLQVVHGAQPPEGDYVAFGPEEDMESMRAKLGDLNRRVRALAARSRKSTTGTAKAKPRNTESRLRIKYAAFLLSPGDNPDTAVRLEAAQPSVSASASPTESPQDGQGPFEEGPTIRSPIASRVASAGPDVTLERSREDFVPGPLRMGPAPGRFSIGSARRIPGEGVDSTAALSTSKTSSHSGSRSTPDSYPSVPSTGPPTPRGSGFVSTFFGNFCSRNCFSGMYPVPPRGYYAPPPQYEAQMMRGPPGSGGPLGSGGLPGSGGFGGGG